MIPRAASDITEVSKDSSVSVIYMWTAGPAGTYFTFFYIIVPCYGTTIFQEQQHQHKEKFFFKLFYFNKIIKNNFKNFKKIKE